MTGLRRRYAFLFQVSLTFDSRDSIGQSVNLSDPLLGLLVYRGGVEGLNTTFSRCEKSTFTPQTSPHGFRRFCHSCGHHWLSSTRCYLQVHRVTSVFTSSSLWPIHHERRFWCSVCYRGGLLVSISCHANILYHTAYSTCRFTCQLFR